MFMNTLCNSFDKNMHGVSDTHNCNDFYTYNKLSIFKIIIINIYLAKQNTIIRYVIHIFLKTCRILLS